MTASSIAVTSRCKERTMATAATVTDTARTAGYPVISEAAWWQIRKLFQTKGMPKVFDSDYLITAGIRENAASAGNVVRVFKRLGLFGNDGKPEDAAWEWYDDDKYTEVCHEMLQAIYPEALTSIFGTASDEDRAGVEKWFQRNLHLKPTSARQYAALYMLLVQADASKQDAGAASQSVKSSATGDQARTPRARSSGGRASSPRKSVSQSNPSEAQPESNGASEPTPQSRPAFGRFEPKIDINVQIHISADATGDQIEQIFKSMAKHLYQRQNEADE
jgi:hypothetical protein